MARRLVLGLILALLVAAPALGDDVVGRKQTVDTKIATLRERIAAAQTRERQLDAEITAVTAKIRALESRVGDVSSKLVTLEHDLSLHRARLARLTDLFRLETRRLVFLRQQYEAAVDRLSQRLVTAYESNDPETIDILLSASSFSDLLEQFDYVNEIELQDRRIAGEVGAAKAEVHRAREHTRRLRAVVTSETRAIAVRTNQVRDERDRLLASQHQLSSSQSRQRAALAATQADRREFVGEVDALSQVSASLTAQIQAAQAAHPYASSSGDSTVSSSGLIWPVNGPVTSPFGMRWGRMHEGIDIGAPYGTPIRAAASGTVIYAGWMGGYGNLVVIDHGRGLATAYAHQSSIAAGNGSRVTQGQTVGYVGCTGHCFGPHLHFEVRVNGTPVDPLGYL